MTIINGTSGNDTFIGISGKDVFVVDQGGNDTLQSLAGNDQFKFGDTFTTKIMRFFRRRAAPAPPSI